MRNRTTGEKNSLRLNLSSRIGRLCYLLSAGECVWIHTHTRRFEYYTCCTCEIYIAIHVQLCQMKIEIIHRVSHTRVRRSWKATNAIAGPTAETFHAYKSSLAALCNEKKRFNKGRAKKKSALLPLPLTHSATHTNIWVNSPTLINARLCSHINSFDKSNWRKRCVPLLPLPLPSLSLLKSDWVGHVCVCVCRCREVNSLFVIFLPRRVFFFLFFSLYFNNVNTLLSVSYKRT